MGEMKRKKVGIMGGTFDPIHIGHLILGENAYIQLGLESVLFMPSGNPPHKKNRIGRASLEQRIRMVDLAISNNPHFELSLEEAHDEGYTYTRNTLEHLKKENPDTDYFFIIGADSLYSFETWKDPEEICRLCTLVVAVRNHVTRDEMAMQVTYIRNKYSARILRLDTPNIDISSHMLRTWVYREKSLKYYLPDDVISYINDNEIYKEGEENE